MHHSGVSKDHRHGGIESSNSAARNGMSDVLVLVAATRWQAATVISRTQSQRMERHIHENDRPILIILVATLIKWKEITLFERLTES